MVTFYKTVNGRLERIDSLQEDCWINVINPDEDEIEMLLSSLRIEPQFLKAALDEEETSHIDAEEDQTLIIVDLPLAQKKNNTVVYSTIPMGIILLDRHILTVCIKENSILNDFADGVVKNVQTAMKTRFVLTILYRVANRFLQYLRQIDKLSNYIEKQLHASMKNKELIQLLDLEKSLVFFSTSLKANEVTLEKMLRGRIIKLYEDDQDLLEDVLIEIKQAIEMSNIYTSILSGTMDAFASVISNNLNIVMKVLTSITILMAIPNMIASFYGMNVLNLPFANLWWFPVALSAVVTAAVAFILYKKRMF